MTAKSRKTAPCFDVSLTVDRFSVFALVGRPGSGKATVVGCLTGDIAPDEGRVTVLGLDARRKRRALRKRLRRLGRDEAFLREAGAAAPPEVLVTEERVERVPGSTVFAATSDPELASGADRVGFLRAGRLVLEDRVAALLSRFRRISYVNEVTETRTDYGTELDLFDAVRVQVRGWGVDAVVSNFEESLFERFRETEGVKEACASPMSVAEIFGAVVRDRVEYNRAK